jgi:hypothetical protein
MMAASSSIRPSAVITAPRPALKSGLSSITLMAASTASRLVPPRASTACPAVSARVSAARYSACRSGGMLCGVMAPAPP